MDTPQPTAPQTPQAAAPAAVTPPAPATPAAPLFAGIAAFFTRKGPSSWSAPLAALIALIWPLAIIYAAVQLATLVGASGWLFVIVLLVIVIAKYSRPNNPPPSTS